MPVLEAMAHGLPVVTSAGSSMAEVVGTPSVLVDPLDEQAIARGILRAVGPERADLAEASSVRARQFTWERAAELTIRAYREAASN